MQIALAAGTSTVSTFSTYDFQQRGYPDGLGHRILSVRRQDPRVGLEAG